MNHCTTRGENCKRDASRQGPTMLIPVQEAKSIGIQHREGSCTEQDLG